MNSNSPRWLVTRDRLALENAKEVLRQQGLGFTGVQVYALQSDANPLDTAEVIVSGELFAAECELRQDSGYIMIESFSVLFRNAESEMNQYTRMAIFVAIEDTYPLN